MVNSEICIRFLDDGDIKWEEIFVDCCGIDFYEYLTDPKLLKREVLEQHLYEIIEHIGYQSPGQFVIDIDGKLIQAKKSWLDIDEILKVI